MVSISIVMPTYNTEVSMLREAVESILNQTYRDYEYIIIDDGSTNDSVAYLQSLQDERIRLIRNLSNLGITKSLNIGFQAAQGKYIARMDSDDISMPTRLKIQYDFMEKHPDTIMCGTNIELFGAYSKETKHRINDTERYRISSLFVNPGPCHPTTFFRRELLQRYKITYDDELVYSQDYGLYVDISKYGKVRLLRKTLLRHRVHNLQVSISHREKQIQCDKIVQRKLLMELLDNVTDEELDLHYRYGTGYFKDMKLNDEMLEWYQRLIASNDRRRIYNKRKFKHYIYNAIIKRTIYLSFNDSMTYTDRMAVFFRYLPTSIALKATIGMYARNAIRHLGGSH